MDLYDQHVHSCHSWDSKADPRACVRTAMARGLAGLTFTEHFDTHPDDWDKCNYDDDTYSATIDELREAFGDAIFIGKGIEVCFQPSRMEFILDFLGDHSFDLAILSVHYFGGASVHNRVHWSGLDPANATKSYLEGVLEAVRFCEELHRGGNRVFDVLGHLDVAKRYAQWFRGCYDVSPFGDLIDEILRTCLTADVIPEINTSTLRQKLGETMPNSDAVRRYSRLGGTAMSLGSDAHLSESVGAGFDVALAMLRDAGLEHVALFENRVRRMALLE